MADDFDDFFDDEPNEKIHSKGSNSLVGSIGVMSSSTLNPIVEVPSEANSVQADSARSTSDESQNTVRTISDHVYVRLN